MLRAAISIRRMRCPSSSLKLPALESGATMAAGTAGRACADPSGAQTSAAASRLATAVRAEALTRELRFARERESLHQALEGLAGLRGVTELVFTQRQLVEGGRGLVAVGPVLVDSRVFHRCAVEPRLGEE